MARYEKAQGRSFQKSYKRIGIRRDRNLSDLSSRTRGLENLLDGLVTSPIFETFEFLATDLEAIKNMFARGLSNSDYLKIAGSAVKFTTPDGIIRPFDPRITYQNRIDKIKIFTGEPRLAGGDGLTAKYYQNDQINFDEHDDLAGIGTGFKYNVDPNLPESNVFLGTTNEGEIEDDTFWEAGNFEYSGNIHPQSAKVNTGVKWEGYFIPTVTGKVNFTVGSTGYFTADFQQVGYEENNDGEETNASKNRPVGAGKTYKEEVRIGLTTSIENISSTNNDNQIVIDPTQSAELEKMNTIGIGMTVVLDGIIVPGTKIENFNKTTGVINLAPPAGNTNVFNSSFTNQTVKFNRILGVNISHVFSTPVLIAYQRYRIRFRYFHHKNFDSKDILRLFNVDYAQTNFRANTHLRYNKLFPLDYNFTNSAKGNFNTYFDNSVRFGGTNIYENPSNSLEKVGLGDRSNTGEYVKIKSENKVDITYKVKQELGSDTGSKKTGITRRKLSCTLTSGNSVIPMNLTTDIEIGNYVFGTGIPENARVIDITINQFVIIDQVAEIDGAQTLTFINHRGFVKRVIVDSVSGNTITVNTNTPVRADTQDEKTISTDVQKDMVVIGSGINAVQITGVSKSIANGGELTLADNVSAPPDNVIFIYQSRGLKDNTLQKFCDKFVTNPTNITAQCLVSKDPITQNQIGNDIDTIVVNDIGAISPTSTGDPNTPNWYIQGFNFANETIIQSITGNATTGFTLTLNKPIVKPVVEGTQFTAVKNSNDDKQLCCPPTDTSPPFIATEEGLNTTVDGSGNPERPNLRFENGNLVFDSLIIKDTNSNVSGAESTDTVNRKINIRTNVNTGISTGTNYKILATT